MLRSLVSFVLVVSFIFVFTVAVQADPPLRGDAEEKVAARITVSELKKAMRGSGDVVVIDMRAPGSYQHSELRIPGDIRIAYNDLKTGNPLLPEDKDVLIATYCT